MRGEHIKKTLQHDKGAFARCSFCGRYSDDPMSLYEKERPCECGKKYGWSGSFRKPIIGDKWSV